MSTIKENVARRLFGLVHEVKKPETLKDRINKRLFKPKSTKEILEGIIQKVFKKST